MHPEIEKLIDLIIIDGKITEKERDVIIKKAKGLGVDADEVIITLDAKLYQKEASLTKVDKDEKYGNRKKCPACGAPVKSMEVACVCGHEFTGTNASKNIITFHNEIKNKHIEEQAIIISSYPIPSNKQDILEFLALSIGNCKALNNFERNAYLESGWTGKFSKELGHKEAVINAWQSKTLQAINQGKILFMDDASLINEIVRYEKQFLEISKDPRLVAQEEAKFMVYIFLPAFCILVLIIAAIIS